MFLVGILYNGGGVEFTFSAIGRIAFSASGDKGLRYAIWARSYYSKWNEYSYRLYYVYLMLCM